MKMKKKLYYQFSDNQDVNQVVMDLSGCMAWIEADLEGVPESDIKEFEYTIQPIYMTERQYKNLPECDI